MHRSLFIWKVIPKNLEISTSCCICPWLDDYFERWSGETPQSIVTFGVIPTSTVTHVVMTYPRAVAADAEDIRKSFDKIPKLFTWIDRLAFAESEDTAVSPRLWESLPQETRQNIAFAIRHENFVVISRRINIQSAFCASYREYRKYLIDVRHTRSINSQSKELAISCLTRFQTSLVLHMRKDNRSSHCNRTVKS